MESGGSQDLTKDIEMNRSYNDYRMYQRGSQVIDFGWWYIDKISDDRKKNLVCTSLIIWSGREGTNQSNRQIERSQWNQKETENRCLDLGDTAQSNQTWYALQVKPQSFIKGASKSCNKCIMSGSLKNAQGLSSLGLWDLNDIIAWDRQVL